MKQTLWERLRYGKPDLLKGCWNPLGTRPGTTLVLSPIGEASRPARVTGVVEYSRGPLKFTDYELDGGDRLRVMPLPASEAHDIGCGHRVYHLKKDAVEPFSADLLAAVSDPSGQFNISQNGETQSYHRANGLKSPHDAKVRSFVDEDGDRRVSEDEVTTASVRYWDFLGGDAVLFIEQDVKDSGQFTFWLGAEVDPSRISI